MKRKLEIFCKLSDVVADTGPLKRYIGLEVVAADTAPVAERAIRCDRSEDATAIEHPAERVCNFHLGSGNPKRQIQTLVAS